MAALLSVESLCSGYGPLPVLDHVSFEVGAGEIVSVVGANGAGKTTLLLTLGGHLRATSGRIRFAGDDLTAMP
ncbi:MAG: ATP-binding cassette domain-containing protein, partial [Burkholderiales bacterium]|nr:ATP-binding cassette domain-containing protein [Burkholderiales bacterium]